MKSQSVIFAAALATIAGVSAYGRDLPPSNLRFSSVVRSQAVACQPASIDHLCKAHYYCTGTIRETLRVTCLNAQTLCPGQAQLAAREAIANPDIAIPNLESGGWSPDTIRYLMRVGQHFSGPNATDAMEVAAFGDCWSRIFNSSGIMSYAK